MLRTRYEVSALPGSLCLLRTPGHNLSLAQRRVGVTSKRRQPACKICQNEVSLAWRIFIWRPLFARLDVVVNNVGDGDIRRSSRAQLDQNPPRRRQGVHPGCRKHRPRAERDGGRDFVATTHTPKRNTPVRYGRSGWIWQSLVYYSNIQR